MAPDTFGAIVAAVPARARDGGLGNAADEDAVERAARGFGQAGARFVDRLAGIASGERVGVRERGARCADRRLKLRRGGGGVCRRGSRRRPGAVALVAEAARGAEGLLLDTADKSGPGLRVSWSRPRSRPL